MKHGLHAFVRRLARLRAERIGLNATATAAKLDKGQLSRWLADGDKRRELRADGFCRLADSLGVIVTQGDDDGKRIGRQVD